jgi:hypothetical protein
MAAQLLCETQSGSSPPFKDAGLAQIDTLVTTHVGRSETVTN